MRKFLVVFILTFCSSSRMFAATSSPATCDEALSRFHEDAGTRAAYKAMEEAVAQNRATQNAALEQRLWYAELMQRVRTQIPVCSRDALGIKLQADTVAQLRSQCQCTTGRATTFDMGRVDAALRKVRSSGETTAATSPTADNASMPFSECLKKDAANAALADAIRRIPKNETVLLLRGSIAGIDASIQAFSQCVPDPAALEMLDSLKKQRDSAVDACKKISSIGNCEVNPFRASDLKVR